MSIFNVNCMLCVNKNKKVHFFIYSEKIHKHAMGYSIEIHF